jgi:transmembrane sensor
VALEIHSPTDTSTEQQAVSWLLRMQDGSLSEAEDAAFAAWQSDPTNAAALNKARRLWQAVDTIAGRPEMLSLRAQALASMQRRRWRWRHTGIAASVSVLAASIALVSFGGVDAWRERAQLAWSMLLPGETFHTAVGERSTITLRDGSVLKLNTGSQARVAYTQREREVVLERGQALFEVAKGQLRPFVVTAQEQRIVATGTAFDVRVQDASVQVTLVEGTVLVGPAARVQEDTAALERLVAGQRLIAQGEKIVSVNHVDLEQITSWTSGRMVFRDTRLADAIEEANRYTHAPITLHDAELGELRINGVFQVGQPLEFARAIAEIHAIRVARQPDGRVVIARAAAQDEPTGV